jgi:hypothetical protein
MEKKTMRKMIISTIAVASVLTAIATATTIRVKAQIIQQADLGQLSLSQPSPSPQITVK